MIRFTVSIVAVLALAPVLLQAQHPESAARQIQATRARAAQARIPMELLETRIAEGRAKGVPEERIAAALKRRADGLARAQEAITRSGRNVGVVGLAAGAEAVEAGVDAHSLRAVIEAAWVGEEPVALAVLGELVRQGLPVEKALERVAQALERRGEAPPYSSEPAVAARERRGAPEAAGGPSGPGRGRPAGVGRGPSGMPLGPPAGLPTVGRRPGAGAPAGAGAGKPNGTPGGKPAGTPGGRPGGHP